ncbi:glutamate--tRNA ligase family protein [Psychrobacter sp. JCM 18903]|nr:glutamate--tRNA ligase family protein [Psychrobacter sp. JCM 18903]
MSEHSSNNAQKDEQKNDFIRNIIRDDVKAQKYPQIVTRFPPEPNGYLHLGHVKSIC